MQNITVIRLVNGRLAWYPPGATEEPQWLDEESVAEQMRATLAQRRLVTLFAVPGEDVTLSRLAVTPAERKHIAKSLPFMLEEELAGEIEEFHFCSRSLGRDELSVAVCSRDCMDTWSEMLSEFPGIGQWIPEPLLLPRREEEWSLVLEEGRATVRTGEAEGFAVERDLLPMFLASVVEANGAPDAVVVYGQDQAADTELLPTPLRDKAQWRQGNFYSALMLSELSDTPVNLLQGEYAPRLPLERWWRQWRTVAAALAVAFGLQLTATWVEYQSLKEQNLSLRAAIEASYRRANPRGAVVDAERQLQRQLETLRGSGQTSGFVSLMSRVGEVIAGSPGTHIASINYSDRADEMRMNIVAEDFESVEKVRAGMNGAGLAAVMENSSAQGDKVRARLRVGGDS